tara:strand:- start:429 stop:704 length:276 start_codon:yes stop_codon:yes gene_type:complete
MRRQHLNWSKYKETKKWTEDVTEIVINDLTYRIHETRHYDDKDSMRFSKKTSVMRQGVQGNYYPAQQGEADYVLSVKAEADNRFTSPSAPF